MKLETAQRGYRSPDDDFYCEKYGIWYPLRDCNLRVAQRTFEGCVNCFQGRVNLRRLRPGAGVVPSSGGDLLSFPHHDPEQADQPEALGPKA
jgi:hypothetical protein